MDRNKEIQDKKRRDYDDRIAAASVRAKEKAVEMFAQVKKEAEKRKEKEDHRNKVGQCSHSYQMTFHASLFSRCR